MTARRPVVGIPASVFNMRQLPLHAIGHSNATAVARVSNCHPMVIPALGDDIDVADMVEHIDGLLLTGGASNIEPHHYAGPPARNGDMHDPQRDSIALPRFGQRLMQACLFSRSVVDSKNSTWR